MRLLQIAEHAGALVCAFRNAEDLRRLVVGIQLVQPCSDGKPLNPWTDDFLHLWVVGDELVPRPARVCEIDFHVFVATSPKLRMKSWLAAAQDVLALSQMSRWFSGS